MFDEVFEGTPRDRFFEILESANKNLVAETIEQILQRMIVCETLLEERDIDIERELPNFKIERTDELEKKLESEYIHYMADIVSKNE